MSLMHHDSAVHEIVLDSDIHPNSIRPPSFTKEAISTYFKTRFTTLFPTKEHLRSKRHLINPFVPLKQMNASQWNQFLLGVAQFSYDSLDFFAVSLNTTRLAETFDTEVKDVTWGITLVLMLRSVGSVIFGLAGDRYGRKWPMVINLILLGIVQIGTGFVTTLSQFLGVRALFGILMGGIFGNAASTALDDAPVDARGIVSACVQQSYALGYLLAVVFTRATVYTTGKWQNFFWLSAGLCVPLIIWRLITPETYGWRAQRSMEKSSAATSFTRQAKGAMKTYWLICIYLVFLMAGFNFSSHGSQDLYPTLLTSQLGYGTDRSTVTNSVANLGAIAGGLFMGYLSEFIGRRLTVVICCICGGAMIYPWAYVRNSGINAGVFFLQFFVQGGWGVVPIHLSELSPAHFRSFIAGTTYQLGNLASSASSTIEATIGERFPLYNADGSKKDDAYDYAKVMAIFMGCVFAYLLIVMVLGPENKGATLIASNVDQTYAKTLEDEKQGAEHIESGDSDREDLETKHV